MVLLTNEIKLRVTIQLILKATYIWISSMKNFFLIKKKLITMGKYQN